MIKKVVLVSTLFAVVSLGCSKKDEATPSKSKEDMLTGGSSKTWKPSSEKVNGIVTPLPECEKDNKFVLNINGNYTNNYGTLYCDEFEPLDTSTKKWSLNAAKDSFLITVTFGTQTVKSGAKILEITDSKIVVSTTDKQTSVVTETTSVPE